MKKILMCRPDYFDIKYEINPWMHLTNPVNHDEALSQWQKVYDTYESLGVEIELISQVKGLPDMVFPANAGIIKENIFVSGNYRFKERKGEEIHFQKWFTSKGFEVKTLKNFQGGEGDALFYKNTLYLGYGFRSQIESHHEIKHILDVPIASLHLINPYFYDFDTAFCPLGERGVLYYPEAFDRDGQNVLENLSGSITMTRAQAEGFVGNSVYVNGKLLVSYLDSDLEKTLFNLDIEPIFLEMGEFKKSGGGIKCVTLILER